MEQIERQFMPRLKTRTAHGWFAEGLRRKIPIVPLCIRNIRSAPGYGEHALPKLGLGYDVLSTLNPRLVMCRCPPLVRTAFIAITGPTALSSGLRMPAVIGKSRRAIRHEPRRLWRSHRRLERLRRSFGCANSCSQYWAWTVRRPGAGRMHNAVCGAMDHRPLDR